MIIAGANVIVAVAAAAVAAAAAAAFAAIVETIIAIDVTLSYGRYASHLWLLSFLVKGRTRIGGIYSPP